MRLVPMRRPAFLVLLLAAGAPGAASVAQAPAQASPASPAAQVPATSPEAVAPVPAEAAEPAEPAPPPIPSGRYLGPASCAQDSCHGATRPRKVFDVLQNEYYTWLNRGRHAKAYEVLYDARSTAIVRNLALARSAPQAPRCLACHVLSPPAAERAGPVEVTDGVSCEACHGPASGWRGGHTAEGWSHEQSVAAGMTDLRDPRVRSAVCLGCHLGDGGREVDHDLIAAGHPPLAFELDNYSQAMPAHWRAKPAEGVRVWAVGQAAAFRDSARELGRRAREGPWPDFSWLSCDACHHSLADERYRQGLGSAFRARPGLPPWSPARWLVLRVLVARYAPDEVAPLDAAVGRLARDVSRLSTAPVEVSATAEAIATHLDGVAERLDRVRWNPAEARRVLLDVVAARDSLAAADLDSAAQAVQAVYTLTSYLLAERPDLLGGDLVDDVSALAREVQDRREMDQLDRDRFRKALARVEDGVK